VHKANLGSQLSIFDTALARTSSPGRPQTTRPNDPPERVHTGALKRPARTTHPNDPPERPTRTTRPNEFTRAPSNDPPERPKRTDKGEPGKRAARTCTKPTSGHNLAFLIRPSPERVHPGALKRPARTTHPNEFTRAPSNDPPERPTRTTRPNEFTRAPSNDPPERPTRTTCPNEFTRVPSHDPPERPKRTDKGEPGKRAARTCTKPTSGHNLAFLIRPSPERVHPGALKRPARTTHPNEFTRAPSNDPPERPTRTTRPNEFTRAPSNDPPERPTRTTRPNEFTRAPSNDPPERPKRTDKGEPGKRAARTCTKPTSGHNLAFLIRPSPERVHPGALKRPARTTHPNDPPERVHTGALKRPARTTHPNDLPERVHTGALKRPARTTETNRQGRAGQTSCTNVHKANLGSQLSIFDTPLARTTRPNEFTRAPSNDPPERVHTGALKRPEPERPTRTSSHGRPQTTRPNDPPERVHTGALKRPARTTRPNEFTRAPSNDPPERVHTGTLKRPARTSSHGRPQTTRPNDPPERVHTGALERPARTTHPNEFTRAPSNDPPERPARTSSHGRPQTTRPNEFTRAPSNDPPERPTRTTRPHEFTRAPSNDPPERPTRTTRPNDPPERPARTRTTRPNEFTRAPSNDPPKRFFMGARTTETNRQGRAGQTSGTNVHKANLGSQLSIFDTALARTTRLNEFTRAPSNDPPERPTRTTRPIEFTRVPSNDPPERFCMGARTTETNRQGRAGQTSCTNVHKANLGSQLSIFYTALARTTRPNEFTRAPSNDPPERVHTGALKLPARTVLHGRPNDRNEPTRESRANDSPGRVFTRQTSPLERVHMGSDTRPKRSHKGDSGKRAARSLHEAHLPSQLSIFYTTTCALGAVTRHDPTRLHGHPHTTRPDPPERNLGFPWAHDPNEISGFPWAHDPNKSTREHQANGPHEHAEDTRAVTT
jgi:hypothetical protein